MWAPQRIQPRFFLHLLPECTSYPPAASPHRRLLYIQRQARWLNTLWTRAFISCALLRFLGGWCWEVGRQFNPPPVLNNCYRTSRKKTRKTRNMPQSSFPYNISKRLPHAHCRNTSNWEDSINKVAAMQSCMIKWHHKQTRWTAPSIPPGRDDSLRTSIRFKGGAFLIRNGLILFSLMHSRLFNGNLHIKIGFRDNRFPLHLC